MKIPFSHKFINMDGSTVPEKADEVIVDEDGKKTTKKSPPFTLGLACVNVLLNPGLDQITCPKCRTQISQPEELTGEEKLKRFKLAQEIHNRKDGLVDIGTKDIELLKELIARDYATLISGQAWSILDPHGEIGREK